MKSSAFFIPLLALCFLSFLSCKKNKDTAITVNKIKSRHIAGSSDYFFYDTQGRVIKDSSASYKGIFSYTTGVVTLTWLTVTGAVGSTNTIYLNSESLMDSMVVKNGVNQVYYKYYYNANGYEVKRINYDLANTIAEIDTFIIVNGNVQAIMSKSLAGSYSMLKSFSYDTTHLNTIGNEYLGQSFYGKSSKNVVTSEMPGAGTIPKETYQYEYDATNRITTRTTVSVSAAMRIDKYTYY